MSLINPTVIFEDDFILVVNKPAGLSVHAAATDSREYTLVDWLDTNIPDLKSKFPKNPNEIWRPGIVHRLDKDTSGVIIIAKIPEALINLQNQFKNRTIDKIYRALVAGVIEEKGEFADKIIRDQSDPTKQRTQRLEFSWTKGKLREAKTKYKRLAFTPTPGVGVNFTDNISNKKTSHTLYPTPGVGVSLVELYPKTGRMHQLRVQLSQAGWPILGDDKYGTKVSQKISKELGIDRQMLYAIELSFNHPISNKRLTFSAPHPDDFLVVLDKLSFR